MVGFIGFVGRQTTAHWHENSQPTTSWQ